MGLSESENRNPYLTVAMFSYHRAEGGLSDEEIADKLRFDSVEDMRAQLESWKLPGWLVGEASGINSTKRKVRKKSTPRARSLSPTKELPPAGNATPLFRERLEALLKSAELLKHLARLKGEDVSEHSLSTAAATSSDSCWRGSFVAGTQAITGDGRELGYGNRTRRDVEELLHGCLGG